MQVNGVHLSVRESVLVPLLLEGLSNQAIANRLFITIKTVKFHLTNIYKKTKLSGDRELLAWHIKNPWALEHKRKCP